MSIVLIVVGGVLLLGAIIFAVYWYEQRRTERLQAVCEQLGLRFYPKGDETLLDRLAQFHLFSQGHSRKIKNMLHGETPDAEIAVFGYRYTTGGGKNSHTWSQTVMYFRSPSLTLPQFALRPEKLFHRIGQVMGYQDIDFHSHPVFSKRYLLRGTDEAAVRGVFADDVLSHFEAQQKVSTEGGGDQLIFYRSAKRIDPDQIQPFMEEGFRVFNLFQE